MIKINFINGKEDIHRYDEEDDDDGNERKVRGKVCDATCYIFGICEKIDKAISKKSLEKKTLGS